MRKGRLVVAGIAAVIAAFFVWWFGHKGGGGVHEPEPQAPVGSAATAHVDRPAPPARASLAGHVTDAAGKGIADAVVRLAPHRDGDPIAARTNADGSYAIDELEPGRFAVAAAASGFLARDGGELSLAPGEHRTLDLQLAPGGKPLTGTVSDATGGAVAGALVTAARERGVLSGSAPDIAAAFTDDNGHYAMTVVPGAYDVGASHGEYVGATQRALVGPTGATVDFALIPGGAIEGTVEDATTGQGVAGARVEVEREALVGLPGGTMTGARGRARAIADGAGHFRVSGLEPGTIAIRARAEGRASLEPTVVPLGVAENATGVIVVVQAAPSVSGTIVDDSGKPAPEATAFLMGEQQIDNVDADATGAFTFDGVKPGSYRLSAGGGGFLDSAEPVPITVEKAPVTGVKLVVRRGAAIRGKVDPPQAAHVEIAHEVGDDPAALDLRALMETRVSTEAAPDGTFALGPVDPGTVDVAAHAADGTRGKTSVQVAANGADGVVIHLDAGASIAGRVTDGKDPVAGAVVTARRVKSSNSRTAVIVNGVDLGADRAPTGADGRFAIAGLTAGDYEVQVLDERSTAFAWRAPADKEHPAAAIRTSVGAGDRKELALEVERPHGVIKGVVLGDDGKPVADAWVSASRGFDADFGVGPPQAQPEPPPAAGSGSDKGKVTTSESSMMVVRTDDGGDDGGIFGGVPPVLTGPDGRFELAHLRRGAYQVMAEGLKGRARGAQDGVEPDADITIKLASLTDLTGTVTANGAPVGDFTVELDGPGRRVQRFLAADGHFTMQRVDPGTYDVSVTAKEGSGHAQAVVTAGQRADVTITLVGHARVTGRVVDPSGAPIANAPVVTAPFVASGAVSISMDGPPDTTGADGTFAIDVEPGKRLLIVLGGAGPIVNQPIETKSGDAIDLGTITAKPRAPKQP